MTRNEFKTENSGENQGVIVGHNSGNINVSIQKVVKIPSLIATVVKTLGEMCVQDYFSDNTDNLQEYRPDEKIEYNCVVKYKEIIKDFSAYYSICENQYGLNLPVSDKFWHHQDLLSCGLHNTKGMDDLYIFYVNPQVRVRNQDHLCTCCTPLPIR